MSALPPKADICSVIADVRYGSKADMRAAKSHVRFAPNSDRKSGHELLATAGPARGFLAWRRVALKGRVRVAKTAIAGQHVRNASFYRPILTVPIRYAATEIDHRAPRRLFSLNRPRSNCYDGNGHAGGGYKVYHFSFHRLPIIPTPARPQQSPGNRRAGRAAH
jgi:hypothetical protein